MQNLMLGPGKDLEARPPEQPVRGQPEGQLQGFCSGLPPWGPWLHWVQNGLVWDSLQAGCPAHPITQHSTQSRVQGVLAMSASWTRATGSKTGGRAAGLGRS